MFGHARSISAGRVHYQNSPFGSGVHVDVIHSNASAADHPQPRRMGQQILADSCRAADDKTVGIVQLAAECFGWRLGYAPALVGEQLDTVIADTVGNDDFHGTRGYRPSAPVSNSGTTVILAIAWNPWFEAYAIVTTREAQRSTKGHGPC